ncbi:MAG: molybdopterin molybdotransferase MoeA [Rhodospirillales bacterium]|nr:molybdopterin molybdotransferase MoeA [Rhodospirillales bacterium]
MISVEDALKRVLSGLPVMPPELVSLSDAHARVLADDVASHRTQPPADVSAMDGYAVRAADVAAAPVRLRRIGESAAGKGFEGTLGAGETVRIFTGAPLPAGADAIVIQEHAETDGSTVTTTESVPPGTYVRPRGLDFNEGDGLLRAGTMLDARAVGLAAAMNVPWISVRRRPRIAILATGDELIMPGEPVGPDQILSSNSLALGAFVTSLGADALDLGIAGDDAQSLANGLSAARGADMLVTIGGASVGDHDLVRDALGAKGLELDFFRIAMRPGKPLVFGRLGPMPVLGLPGNPVSVGVTAIIFLAPAIRAMLGMSPAPASAGWARLGRDLGANDQRQDYLRAALRRDEDGTLVATPFETQDSSMLALFAAAGCLVVRAPFAKPAAVGTWVSIIPLGDGAIPF